MRSAWVFLTFSVAALGATSAHAAGPAYDTDPFDDADFREVPLILDVAHPSRGRGELSLMFASSLIDKYTSHMGGMLQLDYIITDTIGVAITGGYLHGAFTSIVTDQEGVIGNRIIRCSDPEAQPRCEQGGSVDPHVPDYKQITGVLDIAAVWAPLYGKINVVSELDVNLQAYVMLGVGVNGTRLVRATRDSGAEKYAGFVLENDGFGDGGAFSGLEPNVTGGFGLQIFLVDWLALRGEARGIFFSQEFEFDPKIGEETYVSQYWFFQAGLGFMLF